MLKWSSRCYKSSFNSGIKHKWKRASFSCLELSVPLEDTMLFVKKNKQSCVNNWDWNTTNPCEPLVYLLYMYQRSSAVSYNSFTSENIKILSLEWNEFYIQRQKTLIFLFITFTLVLEHMSFKSNQSQLLWAFRQSSETF